MIVLIRVDERLIHGEIVYSWKNAVRYDSLVEYARPACVPDAHANYR